MAKKEKLKNCPFCGTKTITLYKLLGGRWVVQCEGCYATGRTAFTDSRAISAWNRRAK